MDMDAVFKALGDPGRRRLLDALHETPGQTLTELCEDQPTRRQSVSQQLALLEAAQLISVHRIGRSKLHYLNAVPIHEIQNRWIWKFEQPELRALESIRQQAEELAMADSIPDYVYTTYIRATAEQVWHALTDATLTGRYWGHHQISDWSVGSTVDHIRTDGSNISDVHGRVLEANAPKRLSFSFDDPEHADDPAFEPSIVTFDIEADRQLVKLTVTHSRLRTQGDRDSIGLGWPTVLANLKTRLETGDVLPQAPWEFHSEARDAAMRD